MNINKRFAFKILQMQPTENFKEVYQQYRKLAKIYHPDKGGDTEKFRLLQSSVDYLRDVLSTRPTIYFVRHEDGQIARWTVAGELHELAIV